MSFHFPNVESCEDIEGLLGQIGGKSDEKNFAFCFEFSINGNLFLRVSLVDSRLSWVRHVLSSFISCFLLSHKYSVLNSHPNYTCITN